MWPTPPTFLGEEHLEVIRFYENGGSASNRVLIVGPIEKKQKGREQPNGNVPGEKQAFCPRETIAMREVQDPRRTTSSRHVSVEKTPPHLPSAPGESDPVPSGEFESDYDTFPDTSMPDLYDSDDDDNPFVDTEMLRTLQDDAVDSTIQHNENDLASFVDPISSSGDLQAATPIASDVTRSPKKNAKKKRPVPGNSPKARSPARWEVKAWKPRSSDYFGGRKRHRRTAK